MRMMTKDHMEKLQKEIEQCKYNISELEQKNTTDLWIEDLN
jgi:hypothetical protein